MQRHPLGQRAVPPCLRGLTRQAHRTGRVARGVGPAGLGQPAGLAQEGGGAAEGLGVVNGDRHGRIRAPGRVGPAIARKPLGQRLDRKRKPVALLPVVQPARRQQRAARGQHLGVAAGVALGIHHPVVVVPFPRADHPLRQVDRGDRGRKVDQDRPSGHRDAIGHRVRRHHPLQPAEGRDLRARGRGGRDGGHQPLPRRDRQIGRQRAVVVAVADHHRGRAEVARPRAGKQHRLLGQPGAGQPPPAPADGGPSVRDHLGRAVPCHDALVDPGQVPGGQRQPVGRVAHHVGLDQVMRNGAGLVGGQARGPEDAAGEVAQGPGGARSRVAHRRSSKTSGFSTRAGRPPAISSWMSAMFISPTFSSASTVSAPEWGMKTARGWRKTGCETSGGSVT